jgi:hypothetical protein
MTLDAIYSIAGIITALGVVIGAVIAVYRIVRKITDAIGVDSEGRTISERLELVEHQLWENGGSSLADKVNKIDTSMVAITTEVKFIRDMMVAGTQPVAPIAPAKKTRKKAS